MRRCALIFALIATIGCGRPSAPAVDPSPPPVDAATAAIRAGELHSAISIVDRALADPSVPADSVTAHALRLSKAEALLQLRRAPDAEPLIDAPLPDSASFAAIRARRRYLDGYRQLALRKTDADLARALGTLDEARRLAAAAQAGDVSDDAEMLALRFSKASPSEIDRTLSAIRDRAAARRDNYSQARALSSLGLVRFGGGRFDEALEFFEPILAMRDIEGSTIHRLALNNVGICYARLGEFSKAIALQQQAIADNEKKRIPLYLVQALGELGNTYVLKNDPKSALPLLARATQIAEEAKLSEESARWTGNMAAAAIAAGDWQTASQFNERSVAQKKAAKDETLAYNTINRARIAAGLGERREAQAAFTEVLREGVADPVLKWGANFGLANLQVAAGQPRAAVPLFERALGLIEQFRSDMLRDELKFSFLSQLITFYGAYVDALVAAGDDRAALVVADASRARVLAERTGGGEKGAVEKRATAADFMGVSKRTGATLVSYWLGPSKSYAWVVTPTSIKMIEIAPADRIAALAADYRQTIEKSLTDPLATPASPGDALAAAVVQPIAALLPKDGRVIVVPDGALHQINFEMLPVGTPRHYWIEDATIAVAPSLSLLVARAKSAPSTAQAVLVVGDPIATGAAAPALQYASREIDSVAGAFATREVKTIRGKDASPASYAASSPERFGVIHFAAHATVNPQSPLDSSVELSPGAGGHKLYARDVANRQIGASLVTISACRSASARAYSGEGLVGFAWAFLRAGAQQVVAGLWDVDDQSTARLMESFYRELGAGKDPIVALRAAKLAMIQGRTPHAKPYYWAPFQLFISR